MAMAMLIAMHCHENVHHNCQNDDDARNAFCHRVLLREPPQPAWAGLVYSKYPFTLLIGTSKYLDCTSLSEYDVELRLLIQN